MRYFGRTLLISLLALALPAVAMDDDDGDGYINEVDSHPSNPALYTDFDNDQVNAESDNCPDISNYVQSDSDNDGIGNACDPDVDGDGVADPQDSHPLNPNYYSDFDRDLLNAANDNCPTVSNFAQSDSDGDGLGNACDQDVDGDGVDDVSDSHPLNPVYYSDFDRDLVNADSDNCPGISNYMQSDSDNDGIGNACDVDIDGDGVDNVSDYYPLNTNIWFLDNDNDLVENTEDNCPTISNTQQEDTDFDGVGDVCDSYTYTIEEQKYYCLVSIGSSYDYGYCQWKLHSQDMLDDSTVGDTTEITLVAGKAYQFAELAQYSQESYWGLGGCDARGLMIRPDDFSASNIDPANWNASHAILYLPENASGQIIFDSDLSEFPPGGFSGQGCWKHPNRDFILNILPAYQDEDGDGILNIDDAFPLDATESMDSDNDSLGDNSDPYPNNTDGDSDNKSDGIDNCPAVYNPDQLNSDFDGLGDVCDPYPNNKDGDSDSVKDDVDNCPVVSNYAQSDSDNDGIGNACDADIDGDGVDNDVDNYPLNPNLWFPDNDSDFIENSVDNCPGIANGLQEDSDFDGVGDVCDAKTYTVVDQKYYCGVSSSSMWDVAHCALKLNSQDLLDESTVGDAFEITLVAGKAYRFVEFAELHDTQDTICFSFIDKINVFPREYSGSNVASDNWNAESSILYLPEGSSGQIIFDSDFPEVAPDFIFKGCSDYEKVFTINIIRAFNDEDGDGVVNIDDAFPLDATESMDSDNDSLGDNSDPSPYSVDGDSDSVIDPMDNCPSLYSLDFSDTDNDGLGDVCDQYPNSSDGDSDSVNDKDDNCPVKVNPGQSDIDSDGLGDACDADIDGDGVDNDVDNYPLNPNSW